MIYNNNSKNIKNICNFNWGFGNFWLEMLLMLICNKIKNKKLFNVCNLI